MRAEHLAPAALAFSSLAPLIPILFLADASRCNFFILQKESQRKAILEYGASCRNRWALGGTALKQVDWSHCCRSLGYFLRPGRDTQRLAPATL